MNKKRLFIAIGLAESLLHELEQLQNQLRPFARDAKWVKPHGIHLTLKFLGYVDPEQIPRINDALSHVAQNHGSVIVRAEHCGFFPNARRPNVLWAGIESNSLSALQIDVESAMEKEGFEKENRKFTPHLTLARFKDPRGWLPLAKETEKHSSKQFGEFTANHFSLYESVLQRTGAEYTVLKTFELK